LEGFPSVDLSMWLDILSKAHTFKGNQFAEKISLKVDNVKGYIASYILVCCTSSTFAATSTALLNAADVGDTETARVAHQQATQWLSLSGEAGAREFAWRLGVALAQVGRLVVLCIQRKALGSTTGV